MCTEKHVIQAGSSAVDARFVALSRMDEVIFHARDAAVIWGITNVNTLHTTLSRYVRAGLLFRLQNGLYSVKPPRELNTLLVGSKAIHSFCYVSTETILSRAGFIQQYLSHITFISAISRQFSLAGHTFLSRRIADTYLFNEEGVVCDGGVLMASPARAVADMLYFNPHYHFDASAHIDWDEVNRVQTVVGYSVTKRKKI